MSLPRRRFFGRDDLRSQAARRAWWLLALAELADAGDMVAEGGDLSRDQAFNVAGIVVKLGETPFPLPFKSARASAEGLRLLADGFNHAARAPLKQALGVAVAAAARCCRRLLDIDTEETAAAHRRRYGED